MAKKTSIDFDVTNEELEYKEAYTRDILEVKIDNWAKFRHIVSAGIDPKSLHFKDENVEGNKDVSTAFPDIGKSNYQAIVNLGYCKQSLKDACQHELGEHFLFEKSICSFYFHASAVLDALGHLIYMLSIKEAVTKNDTYKRPYRHKMDWQKAKKQVKDSCFERIFQDSAIEYIMNIRNNYCHNWPILLKRDHSTGFLCWPIAVRTEKNYKWDLKVLQEEINAININENYQKYERVIKTLLLDFENIENLFSEVYELLIPLVEEFEQNHGVEIK
jgi:hypothetical protein